MNNKEFLLILNSDFGIRKTIGLRALPIAKAIGKKKSLIFCRFGNKDLTDKFDFIKVVPMGRIIMKIAKGLRTYVMPFLKTRKQQTKLFEYFLLKKIEENNIDLKKIKIIHSWEYLPKFYAKVKKNNPKIKIIQDVAMAWGKVNFEKKQITTNKMADYIKESLRFIDNYIVPSNFVKKTLKMHGVKEEKILVIPFGVDIKEFKPLKLKEKSSFKVAFTGIVGLRKGINYLIEAWKELKKEGSLENNSVLNLYGPVEIKFKKLIRKSKKYNIIAHGYTNIKKELPKNHLFVFPSLKEGSSKAIYEAMACGLPIICTEESGSIIEDTKEGFIIPMMNKEAIKEKIIYFYNNPDKVQELGSRARKKVEEYTWKKYGLEVKKNHQKIIKTN